MAFTTKEKFEIVTFLGWSANSIVSGSSTFSNILLARLTNNDAAVEELAREYLDRLRSLDEKREAALCRAGTIKVGDIELNPRELESLGKERTRILKQLGGLLDIEIIGRGNMIGVCI